MIVRGAETKCRELVQVGQEIPLRWCTGSSGLQRCPAQAAPTIHGYIDIYGGYIDI